MDVSFGLLCVAGLFLSVFLQTEAQDTRKYWHQFGRIECVFIYQSIKT